MSGKEKGYLVNEIFLSLQGEGMRAGTLNVFVRLSKCNMACRIEAGPKSPGGFDCDTEFESGRYMTADEIVTEAHRLWPFDHSGSQSVPKGDMWVVLTGGEPLLQYDHELYRAFKGGFISVAIETNGSIEAPRRTGWEMGDLVAVTQLGGFACDWLTVSPKVAEHAIRQRVAHEVKYVRGAGQAAPKTSVEALHYLISPAHDGLVLDPAAMATCQRIIREDPKWRLSVQQHKAWRVR